MQLMSTAVSSPNIALIKYWGNRNNELRLPAADSLSMVLDAPTVTITATPAEAFSAQSFDGAGVTVPQSEKSLARLRHHFELVRQYLAHIGREQEFPQAATLDIRSDIPPAIGIASSAAVFSCLAEAYASLVPGSPLKREDVSILGRLGSGSGARNAWSGFVALENTGEGIEGTLGREIADATHWTLHDIIIVPSLKEKKVGSTEGHAYAATSPLFAQRLTEIPRRMTECMDAIRHKDFQKLQKVTEEDALDMHRVMETQDPPLRYLSEDTHRIIREVTSLREREKIDVLYTMDAGPTVHLICTENSLKAVTDFAEAQKGCIVFKAKTGGASRLIQS